MSEHSHKKIGTVWPTAFLWMPALCGFLFMVAHGPSMADDIIIWLSCIAVPIVCGIAAAKISKSKMEGGKLWFNLNLSMCIISGLIGGALLVLGFMFGNALRHS